MQMLRGASAATGPRCRSLGFYPGYGKVADLHSLESWLGRDTHYVVQFSDAERRQLHRQHLGSDR